jgi:hypothetical protein
MGIARDDYTKVFGVGEGKWQVWKLDGMFKLTQIYEEAKFDLYDLLELHRIVKGLGMEKQDIINVSEFVKYNQLRTLQWKAGYLSYQINMLEMEKAKKVDHIFRLKDDI